ncbi:unknown [Tannerella sp. CAG:51]|nr:unknown [Tannerella sp. CAG:51]
MSYIDQTTGQVSSICCFQSRISKTFTSTVSGNKIFQYRQSLLKVCQNRVLDNLSAFCSRFLRFCHQTTHTGKLTNLFFRTTSSRIQHHEYRVKSLIIICQLFHQNIRQFRIDMSPCIDNLIVSFIISDETHVIIRHDLLYVSIPFINQSFFFWRNNHIGKVKGQTTFESHLIS